MSHKFLEIVHNRSQRGLPLERVYRKLRDKELLLIAYGRLYSKKGATTPGIDPKDTVDGMSLRRIEKITESLNDGTYKWKPVRRKEIAKKNGNLRPLGLPSWSNKMLQEVIRTVLEAYYEPKFSEHSHAYRPNRGCHTALQEIKRKWHGTKWFIKIDILGCFDSLDHDLLLDIIFRDIKDVRFRKLLKEMLKAGYLKDWKYHRTFSGTPQGGVASPILSNIFLNELDQFVEKELKPAYTKGKRRRNDPTYQQLCRLAHQARKNGDKAARKKIIAKMRTIPSLDCYDPNFRRLKYIRYADDILLGFIGSKQEAHEIKDKLQNFLQTLKLEAATDKTRITHASQKIKFLNYNIHITHDNTKLTRSIEGVKRRSINRHPILSVPYTVRKEWLKLYSRNGKAIHRPELLNCSDYEIVRTYDLKFRGLVNYYALASNVSTLYHVRYHLQQSLVKTLAAKYKISVAKVYKRYAKVGQHKKHCITVTVDNPKNPDKPLVARFSDMPIKRKRIAIIIDKYTTSYNRRNELVHRLLANKCELCGSNEKIEVHHVRALKNIKKKYKGRKQPPQWAAFMIERNRKTVVACHKCHNAIHNGKYDGQKVNID